LHGLGRTVQISVNSTQAAQQLDALLWTFSQGSFIPHRIFDPSAPDRVLREVLIVAGETAVTGCDVLLADGPVSIDFMKHFRWVVHFVLLDDAERRQESRLLWQEAKGMGMKTEHIVRGATLRLPVPH
jgi:DNA polymerase-3 subunit chi